MPVRVAVFGADTALGREVVTDLLFRGHRVTAVAPHHHRVPDEWEERVALRTGDPLDADLVDAVVAAHDVVVDALGDCRGPRALQRSAAVTELITESMQRHGRLRYIGLRPDVLLEPPGRFSLRSTVRRLALGCCPRVRHAVAGAFASVAHSSLSWTVVRCPGMTHGPSRGLRHVGMTRRDTVGDSVTRADAARFLAAQVLETAYICAAPAISN